jgi:hypothetical protein
VRGLRDVDKEWSEGRKRGLAGFFEVERVRHYQHRLENPFWLLSGATRGMCLVP